MFFYATADGTIADPFDTPKSFPGGKSLTLEITFDEFPEEISITLFSEVDKIWFRPFRFYINQALNTVTETIPIPNELREYTISIRDASGDGIDTTTPYKISYRDEVLVEKLFDTGGSSGGPFSIDPSLGETGSPTVSPITATPVGAKTPSPTTTEVKISPVTEAPVVNTGRSASPNGRLGWTGFCYSLLGSALSLML